MTSKADKARYDKLHAIGCIACRKDGRQSQIQVHHLVDNGTRKLSGGNKSTLPLCPWHHDGVPPSGFRLSEAYAIYGPSLSLEKKAFIRRYGTERSLLAEVDALIVKL